MQIIRWYSIILLSLAIIVNMVALFVSEEVIEVRNNMISILLKFPVIIYLILE